MLGKYAEKKYSTLCFMVFFKNNNHVPTSASVAIILTLKRSKHKVHCQFVTPEGPLPLLQTHSIKCISCKCQLMTGRVTLKYKMSILGDKVQLKGFSYIRIMNTILVSRQCHCMCFFISFFLL